MAYVDYGWVEEGYYQDEFVNFDRNVNLEISVTISATLSIGASVPSTIDMGAGELIVTVSGSAIMTINDPSQLPAPLRTIYVKPEDNIMDI